MEAVNILLVDDRPDNLLVLELVLTPLEQNLVKASSGEAALEQVQKHDFAVILLDVNLGRGLDGFETASRIRKHERAKDTPIILLTAMDNTQALAKGYSAGAVDYIVKPIVPEIIRAKVGVFVDLYRKSLLLQRQLDEIQQLHQDVDDHRRATEERQQLLDAAEDARKQAVESQNRMSFLAEASAVLALSLDYETTLKEIARFCLPTIADSCVINMVDEAGTLHNLITTHVDPDKERVAQQLLHDVVSDPDQPDLSKDVLRTRESILISHVPETLTETIARDEDQLALLRSFNISSLMFVPLIARGHILGVLSLYITEGKRHFSEDDLALAEELARRAAVAIDNARLYKELQEAVRKRDEFLSVAAHELKTPITSINGFAQQMLRLFEKTGNVEIERVQSSLTHIVKQSKRLTRLINLLLDISRIQAGRLKLERHETDIAQMVRELVDGMEIHNMRCPIKIDAPESIPAFVDAVRLEQVVVNLLDNAIKFSPEGEPIEIHVSAQKRKRVCIEVQDRGSGIAPEHRERIFERFYQTGERPYLGGMGLGLYVSREIVEMHGGEIHAEFPDEGGTRFVISMPLREG